MEQRPLILICNDDGITAPGINALVQAMQPLGDLVVVAPDSPQSGTGHGITLNSALRLQPMNLWEGVTARACSGTPVDCIKIALNRVVARKPDLIVSGINHGSNASINVLYSGTMSAAVEGAMSGIPSIGFSLLNHSIDADFTASKVVAHKVASEVLQKGLKPGACLNVNIPNLSLDALMGMRVCRQAKGYWHEEMDARKDPSGKDYYWLTGWFENQDSGEDTDIWALDNNYVSVVPTQFDLTAYNSMEHLNTMDWNVE